MCELNPEPRNFGAKGLICIKRALLGKIRLTPSAKYDIFIQEQEVTNMIKQNIKKAKMHLEKIRQLMAKASSPYRGMSKQQVINEIRKTREKLWREKLAASYR